VVIEDKCVGCGICAGACPTATPFKSVNKAYSGINLADISNADILVQTQTQVQSLASEQRILVVGCAHGSDLSQFETPTAVILTGCTSGNCYHRLGIEYRKHDLPTNGNHTCAFRMYG